MDGETWGIGGLYKLCPTNFKKTPQNLLVYIFHVIPLPWGTNKQTNSIFRLRES